MGEASIECATDRVNQREVDSAKEIVVHCKMGGRSAKAYEMLSA